MAFAPPPARPWRRLCLAGLLAGMVTLAARASARSAGSAGPVGEAEELVYGGDAHFPPYEFLDAGGKPAGLNVDLIQAVARAQGFSVKIELSPWSQVRAGLASGAVDVAAMYRSPHRAREVDFAIAHELVYHEMFIRRGGEPVRSLADLDGKQVLVEGGTFSSDALVELGFGLELRPMSSEPAVLQALARGEGDVAVVTQAPNRPFDRTDLQRAVVPTGPPVLLAEYAFVTRKDRRELIERLNQGVATVKASGEYERIYQRWLHPDRSARRVQAILWALLGALVLVALVALWNQSLRRRVAQQTQALRREFDEKERALAALAETERSLRSSQKMEAVGRLAGGVAHDFNNILSVILSYGSALRESLAERHIPTSDVDEILSASERAARLTKQLLAFSRSTPVDAVRLDLGVLVAGMTSMVQRLVGEHIRLETTVPHHPVVVEAEATQIEQMLLNLSANARDAMPEGGQLTIRVEEQHLAEGNAQGLASGEYAVLLVGDSGVGMDQATLARIFEPFFTTKEVGRGTGLGLATVLAQAHRLKGRIAVESSPGHGATFRVFLPRSAVRDLELHPAGAAAPAASLETLQILLVEDDESLRRAASAALERAGHRVLEARDGAVALEIASRFPTPVVVTDVVMPKRSGPSLVAELRRRRPDLLVLFTSGYVQEGERLDLDVPGTAFLAKPYTAQALVEAVHRLIASRHWEAAASGDAP
jgi:signal transduction histidine kinase/ActR/RegA family two-component response regulator